jgi:ApbE superfamily uncharacterized protein (UPF0280 family)
MERNPAEYRERTYRNHILNNNLKKYNVTICETDLFISSDLDLKEAACRSVHRHRSSIETYIRSHSDFLTSLTPVPYDEFAPDIVQDMMEAAFRAKVGPMAAVAGAIAEHVGRDLRKDTHNIIIENGGDLFLDTRHDLRVGIFAGTSPFSDRISLNIKGKEMPLGVCTSSGTIGHSLSFGKADAVCVKAQSVSLADAVATAVGNRVKTRKDIAQALEEGMKIEKVQGIVIIVGDRFGAIGDMELSER